MLTEIAGFELKIPRLQATHAQMKLDRIDRTGSSTLGIDHHHRPLAVGVLSPERVRPKGPRLDLTVVVNGTDTSSERVVVTVVAMHHAALAAAR